jgi:GDP-L-fucose synthase
MSPLIDAANRTRPNDASQRHRTVFVAGHRGMAGAAIVRRLRALGYEHLLTPGREELDLESQAAVRAYFASHRIDAVVLAAGKVGGIHANDA